MPDTNSKTNIQKDLHANLEGIANLLGNPIDLQIENYGPGRSLGIAYLESLTNEIDLKTNLLKPLLPLVKEPNQTLEKIAPLLPETGLNWCTDLEAAAADILQGRAVIFRDKETWALSFKFPGWAKHELKEPKSEQVIRGPREGFTETLTENIGIIRRWIRQ
jgi:spore germination protein KA